MTAPFAPLDKKLTPDAVSKFTAPADWYLCPLTANIYDIQFLAFKIRDIDTGEIYFNIDRDDPQSHRPITGPLRKPPPGAVTTPGIDTDREQRLRTVHYAFPQRFLSAKRVGTKLTFTVGSSAVRDFRMIELHFFRGKLIKKFDFTSTFCIPGSTNTWEAIYDVPEIDAETKAAMIANPFETRADSYYFVGDQLIMHNKAEFSYV